MGPCDKLKTLSPLPQCLRPPNLAESLLRGLAKSCIRYHSDYDCHTWQCVFIQLRASFDKVTKSRDHVALQGHCEKR